MKKLKPEIEIYWNIFENVLIALNKNGEYYWLDDDKLIQDMNVAIDIFLLVNKLSDGYWQKIGEL